MEALITDTTGAFGLLEQGGWMLVKAVLILGAAWGLAAAACHRSAAVRHGIWSVAMALLVVLPLLSTGLPVWRVHFPFLPATERLEPVATLGLPTAAVPVAQASNGSPASALGQNTPAPASARDPKQVLPVPDDGQAEYAVVFGLVLLWIGGALFLTGRLARQVLHIRHLSRRAVAPMVSSLAWLAEALACEIGIRRPVQILCSGDIPVPVTWGLLRPVIMLPREAAVWPEERLRVVLLHELAHIKRWDYLTHLVSEVACACYWPNPLVWFARERVYAEQEQACDDRVLRSGTRSYEYAEHLLEIARAFQRSRRLAGGTVAMAREISLKDRIRAILDRGLDRHPLSPKAGVLVTAALVGIAFPLAALRPAGPEADGVAAPASGSAAHEGMGRESGAIEPEGAEEPAGPAYLWLEAEDGTLREPMVRREDLRASAGFFAYVPDGEGNDAPEGGTGALTFTANMTRTGDYVLWGRVIGDDDNDNSLFVSLDGGPEMEWHILDEKGDADVDRWTWLRAGVATVPASYHLTAGPHTIRIRNREDGTRLDRLLLTDDLTFAPAGSGPSPEGLVPAYLWLEAERASHAAPMEADADAHASGGQYVWVPRGDGRDGEGALRFAFEVLQAGRYVVWGRAIGADGDNNSFYASMDGSGTVIWDIPGRDPDREAKRWTWDPISSRDSQGRTVDPLIFDLQPGRHVLEVRNREDGTKLDGIFITNDLSYRPRGMRPAMPPAQPVFVWLEAEEARIHGKMRTGRDGDASGLRYLSVVEGSESYEEPPADGLATMAFTVPEAGTYTVWGRVSVPDEGNNSFWVRVDGGEWVRWNEIREGEAWHWDEVHDADYGKQLVQFELAPGAHTLSVAYREDGTKLDRLLVTNDPVYVPHGAERSAGRVTVQF